MWCEQQKCTGGSVPWVCEWHVLSHFIMVIPTHIAEKGSASSFREREETQSFFTETLLHTESFTHKHFYTQTLSHRDVFHAHTHRRISTQRLLHETTLTHRRFYTQTLLHTYAFLHADAFLQTHTHFHTQTLLHTDAFAHRHRRFSTQTLLHTDAFTHKHFYTHNPFLLILNVPLILKTGIHLQFPKISVWPIWLLIDPL